MAVTDNARIPEIYNEFAFTDIQDEDIFLMYRESTGITGAIKGKDFQIGDTSSFEWSGTVIYAINEVVTYGGKWWQSDQNANEGNIPTDGVWWTQINKVRGLIIPYWTAGLFTEHLTMQRVGLEIYALKNTVTLPFNSVTSPELDPTNWERIGSGASIADIQNGTHVYTIDTGISDAYEIVLNPPTLGKVQGQKLTFKSLSANTGESVISVDLATNEFIKRRDGSALQAGDILAGSINTIVYDGTNYQLLESSGGGGGGLAEVPILLASSTDDHTSGHVAIQGVVVINGTISVTDQNTLSLLWYIDYGLGYTLANATGTLAGLKTDLEANLLLASDKANVRYVATEQVAYLGDMVNGFFVTLTS